MPCLQIINNNRRSTRVNTKTIITITAPTIVKISFNIRDGASVLNLIRKAGGVRNI